MFRTSVETVYILWKIVLPILMAITSFRYSVMFDKNNYNESNYSEIYFIPKDNIHVVTENIQIKLIE